MYRTLKKNIEKSLKKTKTPFPHPPKTFILRSEALGTMLIQSSCTRQVVLIQS